MVCHFFLFCHTANIYITARKYKLIGKINNLLYGKMVRKRKQNHMAYMKLGSLTE